MTKKTPGVAFYGKVRIPTIGHKTAIDQAKGIAKRVGGKLTVGLSGASEPLDIKTKRTHAQKVFGHPVETGEDHTKTLSSFLTHLHKKHDELHLIAGSDRVEEYRNFISKYNGKADKKGTVPFHFKKVEVHAAGGERKESNKDPRKMSRDELVSSVSASKLEKLAKEGKWDHFKAYHPDMPEGHIRRVYTQIRKHHSLNEAAIGLTFARSEMPQVGATKSFVKYLKDNDITSVRKKISPNDLKSSQMEFDDDKIMDLRNEPSSNPIVVSNDGYVLDGHHRWLADQQEGRSCDAYVCNLPILDLMHHAKTYSSSLNEEVTRKELAPMLDSFVSFASDKLGIKSMPSVRFKSDEDDYNSFAAYNPADNELSVHTKGRHPMDVFRSVAHELVHHKQNEEGRIGKNIAKEGSTGSKIENEANAEAGKIMRWFAQANPDYFAKDHIVEDCANSVSDCGIRGMGYVTGEVSPTVTSHYLTKNISDTESMKIKNSTDIVTNNFDTEWMTDDEHEEYKKQALQEGINDPGKLKAVFLAGGPGSGKDFVMKAVLDGNGLREINSDTAFEYLMKRDGLDLQMPEHERLEREILRGVGKNMSKAKQRLSLAGRLGLIINGTAGDVEETTQIKKMLERLGYETMMVFVNTSDEVSRQRNVERGARGDRKVPDGTDIEGYPDNSPNVRKEKWDAAQKNIGKFQELFGMDKFTVIDNTADQRKLDPEQKEKVLASFHNVRRMVHNFVQTPNSNQHAHNWINREAGKRGITDYQPPRAAKTLAQFRQTASLPHSEPIDNGLMAQARRLGLSYYGFGRFGRKIAGKNSVTHKERNGRLERVIKEEKLEKVEKTIVSKRGKVKRKLISIPKAIDEDFDQFIAEEGGAGEWGTTKLRKNYERNTPGSVKKMKVEASPVPLEIDQPGPTAGMLKSLQTSGLSESIVAWMNNPKTQAKFVEKYGNLAEERLEEAALRLEACGCGASTSKIKKSVRKIYESVDKSAMACNKPRADTHNGKSHVVKACFDGNEKVIRFGQAGVKGSPDGTKRNKAFYDRHKKNIKKGKSSAAYWANKVKW